MKDDQGNTIVKVHHCPKIINYFKDKEVAFIGPAPTLLGKGLGEKIDSYDLVCRASHNLCYEEQKKDYGSRCNVLFHHNGSKTILEYEKEFLKIMKIEKPEIFIGVRMSKRHYRKIGTKEKLFYHDMFQFYSKAILGDAELRNIYPFHFGNGLQHSVTELCIPPTNSNTGLYALFALLSLSVKHIYMTGFDFYQGIIPGKESFQYLKTSTFWDDHILFQREINPDWTEEHTNLAKEKKLLEATHHDQIPQIKLFYYLTEKYKDKLEIGDDLKAVLDMLDKEKTKELFPKYEFIWEFTDVPDDRYFYRSIPRLGKIRK